MRFFCAFFLMGFSSLCLANLKVVTTTTDLGAVAETVGKDKVEVFSVAKGTQDPHQIEAKPSFMVKMRDADLVIACGLELETAWIIPLINGARNPKIKEGTHGFFELGELLHPIEVPKGNVSRAEGDVHPGGNPHFQLDPFRLGEAAVLIADRMSELDSSNAAFYKKNATDFQKQLGEKTKEWKKRIEKTGIKEVVTYHKTMSYFFDRFGISSTLQLEPRPGIPPTASHLLSVIDEIKKRKISLVLIENYYSEEAGDKLKQEIPNLKVALVPVSVGADPNIRTNEQLIEKVVKTFEDAAK